MISVLALGQHSAESNGLCLEAVETEAQRVAVIIQLWTLGDLSASPSLDFVSCTMGNTYPIGKRLMGGDDRETLLQSRA